MMTNFYFLLLSSAFISAVAAFTSPAIHSNVVQSSSASIVAGFSDRLHSSKLFSVEKSNNDMNSDFPPEENSDEYTGSVDWDAEWKKVVASEKGGSGDVERPGKDFYKSEAEIAAIKAANRAAKSATEVTTKFKEAAPSVNVGSLTGDWKFWIAILAIVSIGLSVLSAPPQTMSGGESYYI